MGLWEFLRQWHGSRHATGITVSVLVHLLLLAALFTGNPFFAMGKPGTKPGDALIVDLRSEPSPAAPGNASPPPTAPPQSPAPRARAAAVPPSPSAKPSPPKPAPAPAKPAPPQETPPRVASAPPPPPVPAAPPEPQPAVPPVTDTAGTMPAPAAPSPPARTEPAARSSEPAPSPSAPASGGERQVASVPPAANAPAGQAYVPDIRSLRPGAGGAHGSAGHGRGGIEGDPVALDNTDPRYGDYLARVKLAIERHMVYPCVKDPQGRCDYKQAHLLIEFGIKTDGHLAFIAVRQPAAYQVFDDVSQNAVKLATFPPMPEALRRIHPTGLPIVARFRYITTVSLQSIIR